MLRPAAEERDGDADELSIPFRMLLDSYAARPERPRLLSIPFRMLLVLVNPLEIRNLVPFNSF